MTVSVSELQVYCNSLLEVDNFDDYCPNGLQVEAGDRVRRLASGVTACQALIDAALEWGADALLVHHGYFWKGEPAALTGIKGRRIRDLMRGNLSLLAYHLPLDAHPELGNNRQLADRLDFVDARPDAGQQGLFWRGRLEKPLSGDELGARIGARLHRAPLHIGAREPLIEQVGWCTGAAQGAILHAAALGLDAFVTGEVSEQTVHQAREMAVHFFAAGHHATERYGVMALGRHLAEEFSIEHRFIDIPNPV